MTLSELDRRAPKPLGLPTAETRPEPWAAVRDGDLEADTADPGARRVRLGLLLSMAAALTGVMSLFVRRSGFVGSDFFSLLEVHDDGLSLGFLVRPVFDHFVPGHRFVNWLVQSISPLDFRVATIVTLVVFAASLLVMHRLLTELLRPGPWPLLLTLFYGASAIHVGTALNWASALSRLPADALGLASIVVHLWFRRTGRPALLAASVALLGGAVLFSESAALYLVFLLGLRVLLVDPDEPLGQSLRAVAGEWRVWVPYLLPVLITVIGSTVQTSAADDFHSIDALVRYLASGWLRAFVPALFGQFVNPGSLSGAEVAIVVVGQVVLAAVAACSIMRRPGAWRAWALVALAFVVTQLPVGLTRTGYFTPELVAHQYRYYSEMIAIFTVALGAAFLPLRSQPQDQPWPTGGVTLDRTLPLAGVVGLAAVAVAYVGCSLWTSHRLTEGYDGRQAGPYVSALRADLRDHGAITVLDADVPNYVIGEDYAPYNRLSSIVPLAGVGARVGTEGPDLHQVGAQGRLHTVTFTPKAGGRAVELAATPAFGSVPPESQSVDDSEVCVESQDPPSAIGYNLPLPSGPGEWYLRVRYHSSVMGAGHVLIDRGEGFVHAAEPVLPLRQDRNESVVALGEGGFARLAVVLPEGFRLCFHELVLATVEPRG